MNRIEKKFKILKNKNKKALIIFITAGYPNISTTEKLIYEFDKAGVDIIELGVPFTDPMADGPVIQEASTEALKNKVCLSDILKLVRRVRKKTDIPICLMTYYNPIFCFKQDKFLKQARECSVDGLIIPDLPIEESLCLRRQAAKYSLDVISFIAPTTSLKRTKLISKSAKGFIYYVSLTGTTGERKNIPDDLKQKLRLIKKNTKKPVCVGFGISNAAQVRQISGFSDGVIVGSAVVKKIKENIGKKNLVQIAGSFVRGLKK